MSNIYVWSDQACAFECIKKNPALFYLFQNASREMLELQTRKSNVYVSWESSGYCVAKDCPISVI